jgi:hypothetical protein
MEKQSWREDTNHCSYRILASRQNVVGATSFVFLQTNGLWLLPQSSQLIICYLHLAVYNLSRSYVIKQTNESTFSSPVAEMRNISHCEWPHHSGYIWIIFSWLHGTGSFLGSRFIQLIKTFPTLYDIQLFITVFTRVS